MSFVKQSNANAAAVIISRLQKRNMEGYFCETSKEAVEKALSLMPQLPGKSGKSMPERLWRIIIL